MELSVTKDELRACYEEDMPRFLNALVNYLKYFCVREGLYIEMGGVYDDQEDPYEYADMMVMIMHGNNLGTCEIYCVTDGVSFDEIYSVFEDLGKTDTLERAIAYEWLVPKYKDRA